MLSCHCHVLSFILFLITRTAMRNNILITRICLLTVHTALGRCKASLHFPKLYHPRIKLELLQVSCY